MNSYPEILIPNILPRRNLVLRRLRTVLGQNPPGQNPPDKIPLDKIPPRTKSPRTKSPWTKSPHYIPPNCSIAQYFLLYRNVIFEGQFSSTFVRCDIFDGHEVAERSSRISKCVCSQDLNSDSDCFNTEEIFTRSVTVDQAEGLCHRIT